MRVFNELTTKLKAFYMHICTHLRMSKNGKNVMSSAESPDQTRGIGGPKHKTCNGFQHRKPTMTQQMMKP